MSKRTRTKTGVVGFILCAVAFAVIVICLAIALIRLNTEWILEYTECREVGGTLIEWVCIDNDAILDLETQ